MGLEYSKEMEIIHATFLDIKNAILMLQEWNAAIESPQEWISSPLGMQKLAGNCMLIETIGESIKKIEKRVGADFLNQRPEIPWRDIMGMRNHIAHGYFDINEEYVFSVIRNDLAPLLIAIDFFIEITDENYLTL